MPQLTKKAWLGIAVAAIAVAVLGVTIAGAQSDQAPRGTDPLSPAELDQAADLARGSSGGQESTGADADDIVVLVERREEAKGADPALRRADVWEYSYDDDILTRTLVDLTTGRVVRSQVIPDTQPPLTPDEVDRALTLALEDPAFETLLATRYRQATGRDLLDPATDLRLQAMVFRADANPRAATGDAARCGEHRCAQLLVQTSDDILVNLLPIVDLSEGRLVAQEGFFS